MTRSKTSSDRVVVDSLDAILGHRFDVLDDGFVRVIDYMGADEAIVQAARISYGAGTKKLHEDRGLIRYLMRHRHTTPFEMCELKLHVRVPMDCWRQWIRHRTANVNEYSTRYSEAIDSAQSTKPVEWRTQSKGNRQGSGDSIPEDVGEYLTDKERDLHRLARGVYEERISKGVAREQARKDLPLATYTEAYWKIDLHNLLHFLSLRMDSHAQFEIREYAQIIGNEIVAKWCPLVWEAFVDYRLNAQHLSRLDIEMIRLLTAKKTEESIDLAKTFGWIEEDTGEVRRNREREEFESKALNLGLDVPW